MLLTRTSTLPRVLPPRHLRAAFRTRVVVLTCLTLALAVSLTLIALAAPRGSAPPASSGQVFGSLLAELDLDADGVIVPSEWARWKGDPRELAQFDQDGSGSIDSEEFEVMFMTLDVFHGPRATRP